MSGRNGPLPRGWAEASLEELGKWVGGGTPSKSNPAYWEGGAVPWVSPKDMNGLRLSGTQDHITALAAEETSARPFPARSIAFVVRSGILARTLPIALVPFEATANQDMRMLIPHRGLNIDWLLWTLVGSAERIRSTCSKHGTTVASIDTMRLKSYRIPVPPLAEQERIAETLDALLGAVRTGVRELRRAGSRTRDFERATLRQCFARDDVPWLQLADTADLSSGGTPSRQRAEYYGGSIPWVKIGDLTDGAVSTTEETITNAALQASSTELLEPGTVLLAMYGASIGRLGVLTMPAATNQAICAFSLRVDVINREYLLYFLRYAKPTFIDAGYGGAQPNISQRFLREFRIPVPELAEQRVIVAHLRAALELQRRLSTELAVAEERAERLTESLFREAFRGGLVPQDPSNESASELLETIRAEPSRRHTDRSGGSLQSTKMNQKTRGLLRMEG